MINDFLNQIIQLDKKTESALEDIDKEVESIEVETLERKRVMENDKLQQRKMKLERGYQRKIEQAQQFNEEILAETNEQMEKVKDQYNRLKEKEAQKLVQLLLKSEG